MGFMLSSRPSLIDIEFVRRPHTLDMVKKKRGMQNEGLDEVFSDKGKQITLRHT